MSGVGGIFHWQLLLKVRHPLLLNLKAIEEFIPTPPHKADSDPMMYVARSFDSERAATATILRHGPRPGPRENPIRSISPIFMVI